MPTNVALSPGGEIFVSDGYGNARIHRFSRDGEHITSWGEAGDRPGQFHVPHGVRHGPDDLLYISDRENCRVQRFTPEGEYVDEWADLARPCEVTFDRDGICYIIEVGFRAGMFSGHRATTDQTCGGRLCLFNRRGNLLARFGDDDGSAPVDFYAPHDLAIDSRGDVYIGEVRPARGGFGQMLSSDERNQITAPILHKLTRVQSREAE